MARSQKRGWGFISADADKLDAELHSHKGLYTPTGVDLWLGKDLEYNWTESILWIEDELKELGFYFSSFVDDPKSVSFLPGSEQRNNDPHLGVVDLNIAKFRDKENGVILRKVRSTNKAWPALHIPHQLALNPIVCMAMDGETIPHMIAPGLVVDSSRIPIFSCVGRKVHVMGGWGDKRWPNAWVAAFRKSANNLVS